MDEQAESIIVVDATAEIIGYRSDFLNDFSTFVRKRLRPIPSEFLHSKLVAKINFLTRKSLNVEN